MYGFSMTRVDSSYTKDKWLISDNVMDTRLGNQDTT